MQLTIIFTTLLCAILAFAKGGGAQQKLEKLHVGVAGLSGALAHAFIPKDTGLYEKFGLDVDLVFFQGGTQGVQSLIAGGVQFIVSSGSEVIAARVAGSDITIIAGYMNTVPYSIVADKGVRRFEDLKGGKAAVSRFGTTSDLALRYAFEQNGLFPGKDITLVQLGDQGARFAALTGGTVQATVISPPFDLTAKKLGYRILADMADLGLHYQHEALATTERMLAARPDTARRFLKAFIAGIHVWMTDEKKTKEILAKRLRIKDNEILDETYSAYKKLTRCLETADVILFDELANHDLLEFTDANAELVYVGKKPGKHCADQCEIESLLIQHACHGKTVVRLKGGDPFVFGRGGEEALALRAAGVPFEIVPGISSALAAPAYAGIPVTHRGTASSFAVVTGHNASKAALDWAGLVRSVDTLVILMGLSNLAVIMDRLLEGGCEPERPVALIQASTRSRQQVVAGTVGTIVALGRQANLTSPVTIVVGVVVRLAEQLDWFHSIASPAVGDPSLASGPLDVASWPV